MTRRLFNLFKRAPSISSPKNPDAMEVIIKKGDGKIITIDNVKEFNMTTTDGMQININQRINVGAKAELGEQAQFKSFDTMSEEAPNIVQTAEAINNVYSAAAKVGAGAVAAGSIIHSNSKRTDSEVQKTVNKSLTDGADSSLDLYV